MLPRNYPPTLALPYSTNLKLLLLVGPSNNYNCDFCDISIAFLHADAKEQVYAKAPAAFFPEVGIVWRLRQAVYGLKPAPQAWQLHFADTMSELGAKRRWREPNVYHLLPKEGPLPRHPRRWTTSLYQ